MPIKSNHKNDRMTEVGEGEVYYPISATLIDPKPAEQLMPSVSVDCLIFGFEDDQLKILLIQHADGPMKDQWALPGDFVQEDSNLKEMPYKVLERITGIKDIFIEQLGAFGDVNRVHYRRIITIAYYALISPGNFALKIGKGAMDVGWFAVEDVEALIFDHQDILAFGLHRLKEKIRTVPIGIELLPKRFTLTQLQKLYEAILQKKLDTRNFRRKMLSSKILKGTGEYARDVPYRAPELFEFDKKEYDQILRDGFYLQL